MDRGPPDGCPGSGAASVSLLRSAASVLSTVRRHGRNGCLVGGLAVSVRCDPRFTRDIDLAIGVGGDSDAEELARRLKSDGFSTASLVEQEAVGRLAVVRLIDSEGVSVDLLVASSGIEPEIVAEAEILEVAQGVKVPVARVGHLIVMKLLSVREGRETDAADLRSLAAVATDDEWSRAEDAIRLVASRGFSRDRDLAADLAALRRVH